MRRSLTIPAVLAVGALAMAGCGRPASSSNQAAPGATAGPKYTACMVLDTGGVDDHSFNQSSYAGLTAAKAKNYNLTVGFVSSDSQNDYTPNLTAETNKGCGTVIAVGGLMASAVKSIAAANPDQQYAEIDAPSSGSNVYGLQYNTAQGAFLGGYLAAAMSKTGKVATYGGLNIPPVTIYMDGFWEGVQYYNKQNDKSVQVLGWDEQNQKGGTFVNEGNSSFSDQNKGKQITQAFEQQGADIVFPVAGGAGLGSGAAAAASGGKLNLIWVDTDGCESVSQYCQYFITSVEKGLTLSTEQYVEKASNGQTPSGNYVGTLANGGTSLAPFHDFDSKVPSSVKSDLDAIKAKIVSGAITITSPSQPQQ